MTHGVTRPQKGPLTTCVSLCSLDIHSVKDVLTLVAKGRKNMVLSYAVELI